jgi:hypothetical protein
LTQVKTLAILPPFSHMQEPNRARQRELRATAKRSAGEVSGRRVESKGETFCYEPARKTAG